MELDPGNALADAGLAEIERSYLDRALKAAAERRLSRHADEVLAQAAAIRPGSQPLLETRARIDGIRRQRAETVLAQARSALDSGNADLAEQLAKRAQTISPDLERPRRFRGASAQRAAVREPQARAGDPRSLSSTSPGEAPSVVVASRPANS